jgi:hypothetical protein
MKKLSSLNELKDNIVPTLKTELAPGWPLLFVLIAILIFYFLFFIVRTYKKNSYRRKALGELCKLEQRWINQQDLSALKDISLILKKVAYQCAPKSLSLSGDAWLKFLHQTQDKLETQAFELLPTLTYEKDEKISTIPEKDIHSLFSNARQWIKTHRTHQGSKS